ncbi:MAG TPA: DUF2911 domain-containing protein [Vicinamibacteria bacterium]|nr:DUF2911 domain-containing protein [Vicinamibacteria bacterium]
MVVSTRLVRLRKAAGWLSFGMLFASLAAPAAAQGARGKAEMKAGPGVVTVDYGRPSLKGRDMLTRLQDGSFWRMGMNEATVLTTPVDLAFGATTVAKGSYSLWLKKEGAKFLLVFNSETGQWGTRHDPAKDVHRVEMKAQTLSSPVETFTIDLEEAAKGGEFALAWGETRLSSGFTFGD